MRVLVVTNFVPDAARAAAGPLGARPGRGDAAARGRGRALHLPARLAASTSRRPGACGGCCGGERFDLVHAHYGLPAGARGSPAPGRWSSPSTAPTSATAWSGRSRAASPGASTSSPRVSRALFEPEDGRPGLPPRARLGRAALRPRPEPLPPAAARRGAARARPRPRRPLPALPRQPGAARRSAHDRAAEVAARLRRGAAHRRRDRPRADAALGQRRQRGPGHLRLRGLRPGRVEALACDVPVLSTPVGIAPFALGGIAGASARRSTRPPGAPPRGPISTPPDPRVDGAARAASLSAARMAERTIVAYRDVLASRRNRLSGDERATGRARQRSLSAQVEAAERRLRGGGRGRQRRREAGDRRDRGARSRPREGAAAAAEALEELRARPRRGAEARARGQGPGDRRGGEPPGRDRGAGRGGREAGRGGGAAGRRGRGHDRRRAGPRPRGGRRLAARPGRGDPPRGGGQR